MGTKGLEAVIEGSEEVTQANLGDGRMGAGVHVMPEVAVAVASVAEAPGAQL